MDILFAQHAHEIQQRLAPSLRYHMGVCPELCDNKDLLVLDWRWEERRGGICVRYEVGAEYPMVFQNGKQVKDEEGS